MTTGRHADPVGRTDAAVRAALARMLVDADLVRDLADPRRRGRPITELGLAEVPLSDLQAVAGTRPRSPRGAIEEAGG